MGVTTQTRRWLQASGPSLLLVTLGVLLVVATFEFPLSSTAAACGPSVTSWSPVAGVSLPIVEVTGLSPSLLAFYWTDNCNAMASSLVPVFAAVACFVGAVKVGPKSE